MVVAGEMCGLRWSDLLEEKRSLRINNSIKYVATYDKDFVKTGRERIEDTLKTETSYRKVPISEEMLEILLKHKEIQKHRFKDSIRMNKKKRKWSESEFMFLRALF